MKIFLIGFSGLGKTPLNKLLVTAMPGAQLISASEWVRSQCPPTATVAELTAFSNSNLARNPRSCIDFIASKYNLDDGISIIDGIRNPFDFTNLFDYTKDVVIFLYRVGIYPKSSFEEKGILAIQKYVEFLRSENLVPKTRAFKIAFTKQNKYSKDQYLWHSAISVPDDLRYCAELEDAVTPIVNSTLT